MRAFDGAELGERTARLRDDDGFALARGLDELGKACLRFVEIELHDGDPIDQL
jgi:hypothetical protein